MRWIALVVLLGACAPTPGKVVLVGVDGASWKVLGPMIKSGELPTFARLKAEGASQTNFATLKVAESPLVWTTVVTGVRPKRHGITDFVQTLDDGTKVPVTSGARKVNALWNVASAEGRTVSVINWWASWPAEKVNGTVVSDHANPAGTAWMEGRYFTADTRGLEAQHQDTFPPELDASLEKYWLDPAAFPYDRLFAGARLNAVQEELARNAPFFERSTWSWFKTFYAVDAPHVAFALDQLRAAQPDLLMLYLRGPDPIQHYAWDTIEPKKFVEPSKHWRRDAGVVQATYRYVDGFLAELMAAMEPGTTLIVASDHGAEPAATAKKVGRKERPGTHTGKARGVLFIWGPGVRPGSTIEAATPFDLAPTMAWLLDLPVATNTPGAPLTEVFTWSFRWSRDNRSTPSWGRRKTSQPRASAADPAMLEQLEALGYLEE
jgi:arylsulfatase A-like enzyme